MTERFASISVVTPPAIEPVTLADVRDHLRIDHTDSDNVLDWLIQAAREAVEASTGRALIQRTLDVTFDSFADLMELPRAPLQSVTHVKYLDDDGNEQTLSSSVYRVETNGDWPGIIELGYDQSWPSVYSVKNPVTVRIVAGFGSTRDAVPMPLRQAIYLHVQQQYDQDAKEFSTLQRSIDALISPWVIRYV